MANQQNLADQDSPETPEPTHSKIFEVNDFQLKPLLKHIEQSGPGKTRQTISPRKSNNRIIQQMARTQDFK